MNLFWSLVLAGVVITGFVKLWRKGRQQDRTERGERVRLDLDRSFIKEMAERAKHIESLYHKPKEEK